MAGSAELHAGPATLAVVGRRLPLAGVVVDASQSGLGLSCVGGGAMDLVDSTIRGARGLGLLVDDCAAVLRGAALRDNQDGATWLKGGARYDIAGSRFVSNRSVNHAAVRITANSEGIFQDSEVGDNRLAQDLPGGVSCGACIRRCAACASAATRRRPCSRSATAAWWVSLASPPASPPAVGRRRRSAPPRRPLRAGLACRARPASPAAQGLPRGRGSRRLPRGGPRAAAGLAPFVHWQAGMKPQPIASVLAAPTPAALTRAVLSLLISALDELAAEPDLEPHEVALRRDQYGRCALDQDCPEVAFDPTAIRLRALARLVRGAGDRGAWQRHCAAVLGASADPATLRPEPLSARSRTAGFTTGHHPGAADRPPLAPVRLALLDARV